MAPRPCRALHEEQQAGFVTLEILDTPQLIMDFESRTVNLGQIFSTK
jgi:hypothetical protein